jgi:hypothetical protein
MADSKHKIYLWIKFAVPKIKILSIWC